MFHCIAIHSIAINLALNVVSSKSFPCAAGRVSYHQPMSLAITEAEVNHLLTSLPFIMNSGFLLQSLADGECVLHVPFQKRFERPGAIVSGPTYMAAADAAMWFAILTTLGPADGSVTSEMKTNFLGAAREEDFWCSAKILKLGRRLIFGIADCKTAGGRLLTHHTLTYFRPERAA